MIFNLMATLLVASSIGAPIYEEASFKVAPTAHCLNVDDVSQTIELTADELNNNTFTNLANYLNENYESLSSPMFSTHVDQNNNMYECDDFVINDCLSYGPIGTNYLTLRIEPNTEQYGHWYLVGETDAPVTSDYPFIFDISAFLSEPYEGIISAIEADLNPPSMTDNIFSTIGETITGMINNLSSALGGVTGLFWNSAENKLTVLGVLSVIAVGAGVVYFVFRLIRGLLSSGAGA